MTWMEVLGFLLDHQSALIRMKAFGPGNYMVHLSLHIYVVLYLYTFSVCSICQARQVLPLKIDLFAVSLPRFRKLIWQILSQKWMLFVILYTGRSGICCANCWKTYLVHYISFIHHIGQNPTLSRFLVHTWRKIFFLPTRNAVETV